MANNYFRFKQFTVRQEEAAFKVTTDSVLLGAWADIDNARLILDIGAGTGLLTLMAAQRSDALITAVEPDSRSFLQAQENVRESPWASRITLINSTIQNYDPETASLFDAIITNPPYFNRSLKNPDIRKAASRHSINLGSVELLQASTRLLTDEGAIHLVLPAEEGEQFIEEATLYGFHCRRILRVKPKPTYPVKRLLLTFGRQLSVAEEAVLIIETGGRHRYSEEYISLTSAFYLDK